MEQESDPVTFWHQSQSSPQNNKICQIILGTNSPEDSIKDAHSQALFGEFRFSKPQNLDDSSPCFSLNEICISYNQETLGTSKLDACC